MKIAGLGDPLEISKPEISPLYTLKTYISKNFNSCFVLIVDIGVWLYLGIRSHINDFILPLFIYCSWENVFFHLPRLLFQMKHL